MQKIAREFNFSETAFVLTAAHGHTRRIRIFTPRREVPFAGHPNIGTAFVLAATHQLGPLRSDKKIALEQAAGRVEIAIRVAAGRISHCELVAPQALALGTAVSPHPVAMAIGIHERDIDTSRHQPRIASTGLPFLFVALRSRAALSQARPTLSGFEALRARGIRPSLYLYVKEQRGHNVQARMFAPLSGVSEDPATGSAACALAGLLAHLDPLPDKRATLRIAQGIEIGRPSTMFARAEKRAGVVRETRVRGACVLVTRGYVAV